MSQWHDENEISNMAVCKERDFKSFYQQKYLIVFAQEHVKFHLAVQLFIVSFT